LNVRVAANDFLVLRRVGENTHEWAMDHSFEETFKPSMKRPICTNAQTLQSIHTYFQTWAFMATFKALNLFSRTLFEVDKRMSEGGINTEHMECTVQHHGCT
jgi:hypothetical protein